MTTESRPRVAVAGLVNLVGAGLGAVVGLVVAALVGRSLGTDGAGTYFLVVAVFMVVSQIVELGADTGLVRFVSAYEATERGHQVPSLVRSALRPVLGAGLGLVAAAVVIASVASGRLAVPGWLLVLGAGLCAAASVLALLLGVVRGYHDAVTYPLLQNIALPLLRLAGVATALVLGADAVGVVTGWMLAVVPVVVVAAVLARRAIRRGLAGHAPAHADAAAFWRFSAARGFAAAVEICLEWIDVIIVGLVTSAEAAGVYAVVTRCARIGEIVQQAARIVVGPPISAALARGDKERASEVFSAVSGAMIWLAWPFYAIGFVFADTVLSIFGSGFADGATALRILLVAMAVATAAGAVQSVLLMGGRSSWQLYDKSGALILNVALNLVLVPRYGIEGAAVAWAVTLVVDTLVVIVQVRYLMQVRARLSPLLWSAAVALLVAAGGAWLGRERIGADVADLALVLAVTMPFYLLVSGVLRHRLGLRALLALR